MTSGLLFWVALQGSAFAEDLSASLGWRVDSHGELELRVEPRSGETITTESALFEHEHGVGLVALTAQVEVVEVEATTQPSVRIRPQYDPVALRLFQRDVVIERLVVRRLSRLAVELQRDVWYRYYGVLDSGEMGEISAEEADRRWALRDLGPESLPYDGPALVVPVGVEMVRIDSLQTTPIRRALPDAGEANGESEYQSSDNVDEVGEGR